LPNQMGENSLKMISGNIHSSFENWGISAQYSYPDDLSR